MIVVGTPEMVTGTLSVVVMTSVVGTDTVERTVRVENSEDPVAFEGIELTRSGKDVVTEYAIVDVVKGWVVVRAEPSDVISYTPASMASLRPSGSVMVMVTVVWTGPSVEVAVPCTVVVSVPLAVTSCTLP